MCTFTDEDKSDFCSRSWYQENCRLECGICTATTTTASGPECVDVTCEAVDAAGTPATCVADPSTTCTDIETGGYECSCEETLYFGTPTTNVLNTACKIKACAGYRLNEDNLAVPAVCESGEADHSTCADDAARGFLCGCVEDYHSETGASYNEDAITCEPDTCVAPVEVVCGGNEVCEDLQPAGTECVCGENYHFDSDENCVLDACETVDFWSNDGNEGLRTTWGMAHCNDPASPQYCMAQSDGPMCMARTCDVGDVGVDYFEYVVSQGLPNLEYGEAETDAELRKIYTCVDRVQGGPELVENMCVDPGEEPMRCPSDQECNNAGDNDGYQCTCGDNFLGTPTMNGHATCTPLRCDDNVEDYVECGEGATCNNEEEGDVAAGYDCTCDLSRNYAGRSEHNSPATCVKISNCLECTAVHGYESHEAQVACIWKAQTCIVNHLSDCHLFHPLAQDYCLSNIETVLD